MIVRILMMQKDEILCLPPWIAYHAALVGIKNICIFDNGSIEPDVIAMLDEAERAGAEIIRKFCTVDDFAAKGAIVGRRIMAYDLDDPADFYIPLDCDEFLVTQFPGGKLHTEIEALEEALRPHIGTQHLCQINFGYENDPREFGQFFKKRREKCFFAMNTFDWVDLGFHRGLTKKSSDRVFAHIGYMHMHNKPLNLLKRDARKKMVGRVSDFSRDTLLAYRDQKKGRGYHIVDELFLESDEEYFSYIERKYPDSQRERFVDFMDLLRSFGYAE